MYVDNAEFKYEHFDIVEVANLCGIHFHHININGVEFKALCPFCGDTKYHLGINREKEMFHCFRCGVKGNSVSLFARIYGVSNAEASKALREKNFIYEQQTFRVVKNTEMPMRSLIDRHNVYYDFLQLLKLNKEHRINLENRGLSFSQMYQFMYRSVPTEDVFRREVLEKLASNHDLVGIPGFYIDDYGETQMYFKQCGGILIPVCNHEGYIQGLQIRLDVPEGSDDKKYRWFSSKHYPNGTGAKPWIHVVGDTSAKEACLVEGPMKADITSVLSNGKLFIAIPGVNAIKYLPETMQDLNVEVIYEMLDMDKFSKPEVKKAMIKLKNTLTTLGIENESCKWNPRYKGIDDYYYAKMKYMQSSLVAA